MTTRAEEAEEVDVIALLLQILGLVLLPVGGFIAAGVGGALVALAVVFVFVGLAMERGS